MMQQDSTGAVQGSSREGVSRPTSTTASSDARGQASRQPPSLVFRAFLALLLSAVLLVLLMPSLTARGIETGGWLPWAVVIAALLISVGPALPAHLRARND